MTMPMCKPPYLCQFGPFHACVRIADKGFYTLRKKSLEFHYFLATAMPPLRFRPPFSQSNCHYGFAMRHIFDHLIMFEKYRSLQLWAGPGAQGPNIDGHSTRRLAQARIRAPVT